MKLLILSSCCDDFLVYGCYLLLRPVSSSIDGEWCTREEEVDGNVPPVEVVIKIS